MKTQLTDELHTDLCLLTISNTNDSMAQLSWNNYWMFHALWNENMLTSLCIALWTTSSKMYLQYLNDNYFTHQLGENLKMITHHICWNAKSLTCLCWHVPIFTRRLSDVGADWIGQWDRADLTKSKDKVIWSAGTRRVGRVNQPHLKLQMTTEPTWSYDCTITWRFQEADDGRSTAVGLAEQ